MNLLALTPSNEDVRAEMAGYLKDVNILGEIQEMIKKMNKMILAEFDDGWDWRIGL